jgi:hypothetical protein
MIPMQRLALEEHRSEHGKDNQRNHFLNHLELHQRERTSVLHKTDAHVAMPAMYLPRDRNP